MDVSRLSGDVGEGIEMVLEVELITTIEVGDGVVDGVTCPNPPSALVS